MRWLAALLSVFMLGSWVATASLRVPEDRIYYEIFVRSFQDSNGDGIGDLGGVTSRLDYLKEMGVGGIWLTPIFKSPSYHGYDATDYRAIQPDFGTLADFDALVASAHSRGIRVLLDLAINHTSVKHPWFSSKHDWYVWRDRDPGWPGPTRWVQQGEEFYYAYFGARMPDLNLTNSDVVAEVKDIARFWLARGIDGFRLDAARYYIEGPEGEADTPATHALIMDLATSLKAAYPEMILVGEVWTGLDAIAPYVKSGKELDLAFHFPLSGGLLTSLKSGKSDSFSSALRQTSALLPQPAVMAPFLTNHDMVRIASQLSRLSNEDSRLKLAAAALFSLPGTPFVYYGEEIGMTNGANGANGANTASGTRNDLDKRTPMQWDHSSNHGFTPDSAKPWLAFSSGDPAQTVEDQLHRSGSLLQTYRELIKIRQSHPAMGAGGSMQVLPDPSQQVTAYLRKSGGETVLVVFNFGATQTDDLDFNVPMKTPEILWGSSTAQITSNSGHLRISHLAPWSGMWIKL